MPTLYDNFSQVRQYIDQEKPDLSSYVSNSELESMSYATTTYVADYVAEHGGGGSTVIDENIIPKETNTYTLGDSTYLYNATYTGSIYLHPSNGWVNVSNWQTKFRIDNSDKYYLTSNRFYPNYSGQAHLGSSANSWGDTYTNSLYLNGTNIEDIFVSKTDAAFIPYTYNGYTSYISTYTYNATSSPYLDGSLALAKGNGLVLGGINARISGEYTISNGRETYACADNSVAFGSTAHTYGWSSFAMGRNVTTWNFAEVALGLGNFSSSASYTYTGHANYNPDNANAYKETVFSIGGGGMNATYTTGWNRIEIRANNDIYTYGVGNYNGSNASDSTTYSLQYILNNTFSYNSTTGELTINTF